jgi:hypothetical protein
MARTRLARAALLALAALLPACDYQGVYHVDYWSITVDNRAGLTLEVFLDGRFRATVTHDTVTTIHDVPEGSHTLEAFDLDGRLRARRDLYLASEFVWVLE